MAFGRLIILRALLWATTPSVENLVSGKFGEAIQKWLKRLDVFIYPKIMMPVWGRLLLKVDDLVVSSPPGETFYPSSMHE